MENNNDVIRRIEDDRANDWRVIRLVAGGAGFVLAGNSLLREITSEGFNCEFALF